MAGADAGGPCETPASSKIAKVLHSKLFRQQARFPPHIAALLPRRAAPSRIAPACSLSESRSSAHARFSLPSAPTMSSAGADPSSAFSVPVSSSSSSSSAAAAAAAAGALVRSVFVKASGPRGVGKQFLKVATSACEDVADLAVRVAAAFPAWNAGAEDIALFLVSTVFAEAVEAGDESVGVAAKRLFSGASLVHAGVSNGAFLLVRLPDPPAAAPGECACGDRSLLSCSSRVGGRRGSRDVR